MYDSKDRTATFTLKLDFSICPSNLCFAAIFDFSWEEQQSFLFSFSEHESGTKVNSKRMCNYEHDLL